MYGQGQLWQTCRLAELMSKKFTNAQQNYAVYELEMLVILEALLKWEDNLIGYDIHIITNHQALEFFKTQANLLLRQWQWINYMSHYKLDITYVKGELNKVVDCISQYFKSDHWNEAHEAHYYVNADVYIDSEEEDILYLQYCKVKDHVVDVWVMQVCKYWHSKQLQEQ